MKVKYGIPANVVSQLVPHLSKVLANAHVLMVKTLNYHWNMEDERFHFLHLLLEGQYEELLEITDMIAERIRQMGEKSPATLSEFIKLSTVTEGNAQSSCNEMLEDLASTHEQIMHDLRSIIDIATQADDFGTADTLTELLRKHEKTAWFLRSHL